MTLSREARIILAILAVAAAAFVWVNYYNHGSSFGDLFSGRQGSARAPSAEFAPLPPSVTGPTANQEPGNAPVAAVPATVPTTAPVAAKDIEIAELPFLITSPPAQAADVKAGMADDVTAESPTEDTAGTRRVSINPFSPIIVAVAKPAPAQRTPQVRVVDIPTGPPASTAPASVRAPAPAPALPGGQVAGLPRALPGGTLPVATDILRSTRTGVAAQGFDLAQVAAVSVPDGVSAAALAEAGTTGPQGTDLQILNPRAPRGAVPAGGAPLAAGTSPLSRYLRDNNVSFTGSVLGPISVGVFRSSQSNAPVVVALGQPLPDTDIILTSLKGQQAVLTQGAQSQTLILDLRR